MVKMNIHCNIVSFVATYECYKKAMNENAIGANLIVNFINVRQTISANFNILVK